MFNEQSFLVHFGYLFSVVSWFEFNIQAIVKTHLKFSN